MADLDVNQKAQIYETLASLNMAFAGIVQHLKTLHDTGLFRSKASKLFPDFAQELQAEFNQEFLEALEAIELEDWARFGKTRQKWEKYIGDPDDVFIHAEERRKELARKRKKR
jgi:hypothetical protein